MRKGRCWKDKRVKPGGNVSRYGEGWKNECWEGEKNKQTEKQKTVVVARRRLRSLTKRVWTDKLETLISCLCILLYPFFSSLTFTNSGGHPTNLVKLLEMLRFSSLFTHPLPCHIDHHRGNALSASDLPLLRNCHESYNVQQADEGRGAHCLQSCVLEF